MRFIAVFTLAASLALGLQPITAETDCAILGSKVLSSHLPSSVHWAQAGCQQALVCKDNSTKDCCISRVQRGLPLPLRYDDAAAYYQKCAGISVPKPRREDDIVLPSLPCDMVRHFRCGTGADSEFCHIVFAEREGCKMFDKCSKKTDIEKCCGVYPTNDPELSRRYLSKCLGECSAVTDKIVEQDTCLAVGGE